MWSWRTFSKLPQVGDLFAQINDFSSSHMALQTTSRCSFPLMALLSRLAIKTPGKCPSNQRKSPCQVGKHRLALEREAVTMDQWREIKGGWWREMAFILHFELCCSEEDGLGMVWVTLGYERSFFRTGYEQTKWRNFVPGHMLRWQIN